MFFEVGRDILNQCQHFDRLSAFSSIEFIEILSAFSLKYEIHYVYSSLRQEHKDKKTFFTKKFSDIQLIYIEEFSTLIHARRREKQLKGWSHAKKKALIEGNKMQLKELSKSTAFVEELIG